MTMSSKRAAAKASKALLLAALQAVLDSSDINPALAKKLRYARQQGYVDQNKLTDKGRELLNERVLWELKLPRPKKWDGKWRLVVFDIPKDRRKRRDSFRRKLHEFGLQLYQNSVWIYPYPLEAEVRQLADVYRLSGCVSFIVAEEISDEYAYLKRFGL